jgi:cyclopropane fatty-acyl-phospholipid synthase-like methyltransferase
MTADDNAICKTWYEDSYNHAGFSAQRRYPNDELLRFFGRHYFMLSRERRAELRVLEVGCGSGANLWMIAREGFDAHGIDLSPEGIALCAKMLQAWGTKAEIKAADMTAIPYSAPYFDVIVDVFSSYCVDETGFARFLDEAVRLLRPGGRFFSYTPSKASDAFKDPGPSKKLDASTLDGIRREDAPFTGNLYPFRFMTGAEYATALESRDLRVTHNETVGRTYRGRDEYFEFVVIVGEKSPSAA